MGLSALSIPAIALGSAVWAVAKRIAGMKLPTVPIKLTHSHCSFFRDLQCRREMGSKVNPAMAIRSAASSTGGKSGLPSVANSPHFIRIKLLPQTKPRSSKTNAGAQRCLGDGWLGMGLEIKLCWVCAALHQRIFAACTVIFFLYIRKSDLFWWAVFWSSLWA